MTQIVFRTSPFTVVPSVQEDWIAVNGTFSRPAGPGHAGPGAYGRLAAGGTSTVTNTPFTLPPMGGGAGATMAVSVWLKGTVGLVVSVQIVWADHTLTTIGTTTLASTTTWQQVTGTVDIPHNATSAQLRVRNTTTATGNVDFDDMSVAMSAVFFGTTDYSVQENGGNLDASKLDGGYPQITATMEDFDNSARLLDNQVSIIDPPRGSITGVIRGMSGSNGTLTVTADSTVSKLNVFKAVPPPPAATNTFGAYITWLKSYLNISLTTTVDAAISGDSFPFPGFVGNVFDQLKMLCAARNYSLVGYQNSLAFRPARQHVLDETFRSSYNYDLDTQQTAQKIIVNYYNYSANGNFAAYPPPGSNPSDLSPLTVNAGQTVVQTFQIAGSARSVSQPVAVDTITLGATNQYAILKNNGEPMTAAQWRSEGGAINVRVLPSDPSQIEVTVRGPRNKTDGPFRIAEASDVDYSALYIQAQGYSAVPSSVTISTGASPDVTSEEVGITVNNPYISTLADAYTNGAITSAYYGGPVYTVSDTAATLINPNFPANETFGTLVGNRLKRNDAAFIVTSSNVNPSSVTYSAVLDTMISDFNTVWSGYFIDDFNAQWAGYTFNEMASIPLRRN